MSRLVSLLESLDHGGIKPGLERSYCLLDRLGDPHLSLPPVVHVAGTNGKASTIACMRAMLEAAGLRVHVYSSPHLVRFNERIVLAGQQVSDAELAVVLERVQPLAEQVEATFFEATTVAAFCLFAEHDADILLLETGMGGRLDTTNVVPCPIATVITSISMDHQAFLGDSLAAIASEKAGIIKPDVPCIIAPQKQEALDVLLEKAADVEAPAVAFGHDWRSQDGDTGLMVEVDGVMYHGPEPSLTGDYQRQNAATAIVTLHQLIQQGVPLPSSEIWLQGLSQVELPGRMQHLTKHPLLRRLPVGSHAWLDGGHNEAAGQALAHAMKGWGAPRWLICGMMADKDVAAFLRHFKGVIDGICAVPVTGEARAMPPHELADIANEIGFSSVLAADSVTEACGVIHQAVGDVSFNVLIGGSFYLAGQVLAMAEADERKVA